MYIVQPEPIPCSTKTLDRIRTIAGGSSQKEILFRRGKAIFFCLIKKPVYL